jgi:5-carboxymethyl-2-hydroxymuconate isomerase
MSSVFFKNGSTPIQVGKIVCVGRNYAEHVKEMHVEVADEPVLFLKPSSALLRDGGRIVIPPFSSNLHYEVELVVLIGTGGKNVSRARALAHVAGYGVGLDMTLRDVQAEAKRKGLPWVVAKGFDTSAPVSAFLPASSVEDPHDLLLTLKVNGQVRQQSSTSRMLFRIDELVSYISERFTLEEGDLIFTGTPEGVGRTVSGDVLEASVESVASLTVSVA